MEGFVAKDCDISRSVSSPPRGRECDSSKPNVALRSTAVEAGCCDSARSPVKPKSQRFDKLMYPRIYRLTPCEYLILPRTSSKAFFYYAVKQGRSPAQPCSAHVNSCDIYAHRPAISL